MLALRQRPDQRLDLSPLVPHLLAGKAAAEIERIELQTTKHRVTVGDAFRLRFGEADRLRIEGACDRLDRIGQDMDGGEIRAEGDVGIQAGRGMRGGRLAIEGSAGAWAASGMSGGHIEISGTAGDRLGGPLPGEIANITQYAAGAVSAGKIPDAAKAFISFISTPSAVLLFKAKGYEPG